MIAVIQRVSRARVTVNDRVTGEIGTGLAVLVGIARTDTSLDADYLAAKVAAMRIFPDAGGKMNVSVTDAGGRILAISQFTLYGRCRKGNRPSFDLAADANIARPLYERFVEAIRAKGVAVETGEFQASMSVELVNEGPVTIICESDEQHH